MRKLLISMITAGAAFAFAAPVLAQHHAAPPAPGYHRSSLEMAL